MVSWNHPLNETFCMKKVYYLSTCTTCQAILKATQLAAKGYELQDIKAQPITDAQLEEMHQRAGSYEALFSRRAIKYKELNLKNQQLTEADYRKYLLDEYTFLKRPVVVNGNRIFIGNEKKTIEALVQAIWYFLKKVFQRALVLLSGEFASVCTVFLAGVAAIHKNPYIIFYLFTASEVILADDLPIFHFNIVMGSFIKSLIMGYNQ